MQLHSWGYMQASRRILSDEIAANYSEDEILEVITGTRVISLLAALEMFLMAGRQDLDRQLVDRMG